jgi:hypothetical protein
LQEVISCVREYGERADLLKEAKGGNLFLCTYEAEVVPNRGKKAFAYVIPGRTGCYRPTGQRKTKTKETSLGNVVASRRTT